MDRRLGLLLVVSAAFLFAQARVKADLTLNSRQVLPGTLRTFLTQDTGPARLTEQPVTTLGHSQDNSNATVFVDSSHQFQSIVGFGGAFTEAAAVTWLKLSPENQKAVIDAYFNSDTGLGYTICRTHINSCDFSVNNYAYDEVPGDTELKNFSIAHDEQVLLPMIKAALATSATPFKLFAAPWSPPAWMKTNDDMNHGGKLKPEYRQAWANYFVRYLEAYKQQGVNLWAVSMQNEPEANTNWDTCLYSPAEERDFIRDYLGPTLKHSDMRNVKILAWDHNLDHMDSSVDVIYSDKAASRYIWGTAFHWYSNGATQNLSMHHDAWPDKPLLSTEGCQGLGSNSSGLETGEIYGTAIIDDLNRWSVGWVDWNMLLDTHGGPNHAGNFCGAPILADTQNDKLFFQSSYYYLGQFARFIRPGAKVILCSSSDSRLTATAGLNQDGTVALVVMNHSDDVMQFNVASADTSTPVSLPPHSIATFLINSRDL